MQQNAFIKTTLLKKQRPKCLKNKGMRLSFILVNFVFAALAIQAQAVAKERNAKTNSSANCIWPCWAAVGIPYADSCTHAAVLARAGIIAVRGRGRLDMRRLILLQLLMGGVELNPGPAKKGQKKNNAKNVKCHLCDKTGSRNSIKMQCGECQQWNHATCLGLSEKEKRKYRQAGYTCYPCSLPAALSDSFLSLEPP
ncbi:MAG: hypothetical protein ACRC8Q_01060, partial [Aeromonas sp.]